MSRLQGMADAAQDSRRAANENDAAPCRSQRHRGHDRKRPHPSLANQSVIEAFEILRSFYHPNEWLTVGQLSQRAEADEASVRQFMPSLVEVGAVERADDGRYRCIVFVMPGNYGTQAGSTRAHQRSRPEWRAP